MMRPWRCYDVWPYCGYPIAAALDRCKCTTATTHGPDGAVLPVQHEVPMPPHIVTACGPVTLGQRTTLMRCTAMACGLAAAPVTTAFDPAVVAMAHVPKCAHQVPVDHCSLVVCTLVNTVLVLVLW